MKKYFAILFLLSACTEFSDVNDVQVKKVDEKPKLKNEKCLEFSKVKVFQVLDTGHALATVCEDNYSKYCNGKVVLLGLERKYEYYDEMMVEPETDKCFKQYGVYRYEAKNGMNKTVPSVRFDYKYYSYTGEEKLYQVSEIAKDHRFLCERYFKQKNRSDNGICECRGLYLKRELGSSKTIEEINNILDNRCGKWPD